MIVRREATQLTGIIDRLSELLGSRDGYNGQDKTWRVPFHVKPGKHIQIEFGSTPNAGDETKYQGRPHDLLVFDEATNLLEHQVRQARRRARLGPERHPQHEPVAGDAKDEAPGDAGDKRQAPAGADRRHRAALP